MKTLLLIPYLLLPLLMLYAQRLPVLRWLGAAILCYIVGIGMGLGGLQLPTAVQDNLVGGSILLALPLLTFTADLRLWLRQGRQVVLAFGLAVLVGAVVTVAMAQLSAEAEAPLWGGMLAGVYIGGTPNMAAIAYSMRAPAGTLATLHLADTAWSALYILLMLRAMAWLLRPLLPDRTATLTEDPTHTPEKPRYWLKSALLALLVAGSSYALVALGLHYLPVPAEAKSDYLFAGLVVTASCIGLGLSLRQRVRRLTASQPLGDYLMLVFCLAFGSRIELQHLQGAIGPAFWFTGITLGSIVVLYYLLCILFRVDRDTAIIVSCATTQGPAFISPIAYALHKHSLIAPGIATGIAGYAVGTYVGLAVALWA